MEETVQASIDSIAGDAHAVRDVLTRHSQRRSQSVPTISLLNGPTGLAVRAWRQWAASEQRSVVQTSHIDAGAVLGRWLETLARHTDLPLHALPAVFSSCAFWPTMSSPAWKKSSIASSVRSSFKHPPSPRMPEP